MLRFEDLQLTIDGDGDADETSASPITGEIVAVDVGAPATPTAGADLAVTLVQDGGFAAISLLTITDVAAGDLIQYHPVAGTVAPGDGTTAAIADVVAPIVGSGHVRAVIAQGTEDEVINVRVWYRD
jgi:hypothetical protein